MVIISTKKGRIKGILPLFLYSHWYFGKKLISIPFSIYGGTCADSEPAEQILIKKAIDISVDLNVDFLELRNVNKKHGNLITNKNYITMVLNLSHDPERLWKSCQSLHRLHPGWSGMPSSASSWLDRAGDAGGFAEKRCHR